MVFETRCLNCNQIIKIGLKKNKKQKPNRQDCVDACLRSVSAVLCLFQWLGWKREWTHRSRQQLIIWKFLQLRDGLRRRLWFGHSTEEQERREVETQGDVTISIRITQKGNDPKWGRIKCPHRCSRISNWSRLTGCRIWCYYKKEDCDIPGTNLHCWTQFSFFVISFIFLCSSFICPLFRPGRLFLTCYAHHIITPSLFCTMKFSFHSVCHLDVAYELCIFSTLLSLLPFQASIY